MSCLCWPMLATDETPTKMFFKCCGHGTFNDMMMDTICTCVRTVLFNVLCALLRVPEDFILRQVNPTKIKIATRMKATRTNTLSPLASHFEHCPVSTSGAHPLTQMEHLALSMGGFT